MQIESQKQARFLGAAASGKVQGRGPTPAKALLMLRENRGFRMRDLPVRAPRRLASRLSRRGGR